MMRLIPVLFLVLTACASGDDPVRVGDPVFGDPVAGDPVVGDAAGDHVAGAGDPSAGDPLGDPGAGDPGVGDPLAGDPVAGDPVLTPCGIVVPPVVVLETTVAELNTAINAAEELVVVDVREPSETTLGIIEGALLYPWFGGVLEADHADLPGDRPLYIVCASGNRSAQAAQFLVNNGHVCVHTVLGGMNAWNSASYPTVTP